MELWKRGREEENHCLHCNESKSCAPVGIIVNVTQPKRKPNFLINKMYNT